MSNLNNMSNLSNLNKEVNGMNIPVDRKILKLIKRIKNLRKDEKLMLRISKNYLIIFNRYLITKTYYFVTEEVLNYFKGKTFEIVKVNEKERKLYLKEIETNIDIEEFLNNFLKEKEGNYKFFKKRKTKLIEDALLASYELANREYFLTLDYLKILEEFYESYVLTYLNEAYLITDSSNLNHNTPINTYTIIGTLKVNEEDFSFGNFKFGV